MATWGDTNVEKSIQDMVRHKINKNNNINKIWSNFPNKIDQILRAGFNKVHSSAVSTINKTNKYVNKSLKVNQELLKYMNSDRLDQYVMNKNQINDKIENKSQIILSQSANNENSENNQKESNTDEERPEVRKLMLLQNIGCTVNIARNKLINQLIKLWKTCEAIAKTQVKIWVSWAEFWHAGHILESYFERPSKVSWSWGNHLFSNFNIYSNKNIPPKVDSNAMINENCWTMIKDDLKYKKIKELMYKEHLSKMKNNDMLEQFENKQLSSRSQSLSSQEDNELDELKATNNLKSFQKLKENLRISHKIVESFKNKQINFASELNKYSSANFINDLIRIFDLDISLLKKSSPKLFEDSLYFYDESLERNSHIYEQFILLAKGFWRPSLIRILTWANQYEYELSTLYLNSKRFNSMMSLVSLQQGDFEYFEKTWRGVLMSLGVKDSSEISIEEKGARIFHILKGSNYYTSLTNLWDPKIGIKKLFQKIFPNNSTGWMCIHKYATFNNDQLIYISNNKNKIKERNMDIDKSNLK